MIEINHQQARRLLKSALDRQIPSDQWNSVQNHLEICPDCRLLYAQLKQEERYIRRSLHARWDVVSGPSGVLQTVIQTRRRRAKMRARSMAAASLAASILLVFLALNYIIEPQYEVRSPAAAAGRPAAEGTISPQIGTAISATRFPTPEPGMFQGIVAYDTEVDGNPEIYLYNPGSKPVNLTNNPARDTDASWSPDGEWLAFPSDRAAPKDNPGKKDLFVMSIAGNHLVQLTEMPEIDWQGPVAWSDDGQWIVLNGTRLETPRQQEIHAVPVDRLIRQAISSIVLEQAQGEWPAPGYIVEQSISFSNLPEGRVTVDFKYVRINNTANYSIKRRLIYPPYVGAQSADLEVFSSGSANISFLPDASMISIPITGGSDAPVSACEHLYALSPRIIDGRLLYKQGLYDALPGNSEVWATNDMILFLSSPLNGEKQASPGTYPNSEMGEPLSINQLCVASKLRREYWTSNSRWLVVAAYLPGEKDTSLYAVHMPDPAQAGAASYDPVPLWTTVKLVDSPIAAAHLVVRPARSRMAISP